MTLATIAPPSYSRLQAGTISIGAKQLPNTNSLNAVMDELSRLRLSGVTQPIRVDLNAERYYWSDGNAYNIAGIEFVGVEGTQIEFRGTTPAKVTVPSDSGYPTTKTITTGCLGLYIEGQRKPRAAFVGFRNIEFVGYTGTASAAGHYYLLGGVATHWRLENCTSRQEESATYDSTNNVPYKALSARNCTTLTLFQPGEDRWIEPNADWAGSCERVTVRSCSFHGEPLAETSGATAVYTPVRIRKASHIDWEGNTFGSCHDYRSVNAANLNFTGVPANNDTVLFVSWNPYTKESTTLTYTFKTANPSGNYEILRGSTALEARNNLAAKIRDNSVVDQGGAGTDFIEAVLPNEYLGAGLTGTVAALKVQSLEYDSGEARLGSKTSNVPLTAFAAVGVGTAITVTGLSKTGNRTEYLRCAIVKEDCATTPLGKSAFHNLSFSQSLYYEDTTGVHNDFSTSSWAENETPTFSEWTGHTLICQSAPLIDLRGAGFSVMDSTCHFGQVILGTTGAQTNPAIHLRPGTNVNWNVTLAGQPADGNTITVADDGHGGTKVFEFDSNSSVTGSNISVTIGASTTATLQNLRKAIQAQYDAKNLTMYGKQPSSTVLNVVFVTFSTRSATPSITKVGANITVADNSQPYRPYTAVLNPTFHWVTGSSAGEYAATTIRAEKVYGPLYIGAHLAHERYILPSESSQAISLIQLLSVPTDGSTITFDSIGAGSLGTAHNFIFDATPAADDANNTYINTTGLTVAQTATLLATKIQSSAVTNGRSFWGVRMQDQDFGFGTQPVLSCWDGTAGVNAALLAKSGGDSATSIIVANSETGDASIETQGRHAPIVLDDVAMAVIDVKAAPMANGAYSGTTFSELYAGSASITTLDGAFFGAPKMLVYAKKSSAAVTSKVLITADLMGPWGSYRTGGLRVFDLGANMVAGDVIQKNSYINGYLLAS